VTILLSIIRSVQSATIKPRYSLGFFVPVVISNHKSVGIFYIHKSHLCSSVLIFRTKQG